MYATKWKNSHLRHWFFCVLIKTLYPNGQQFIDNNKIIVKPLQHIINPQNAHIVRAGARRCRYKFGLSHLRSGTLAGESFSDGRCWWYIATASTLQHRHGFFVSPSTNAPEEALFTTGAVAPPPTAVDEDASFLVVFEKRSETLA